MLGMRACVRACVPARREVAPSSPWSVRAFARVGGAEAGMRAELTAHIAKNEPPTSGTHTFPDICALQARFVGCACQRRRPSTRPSLTSGGGLTAVTDQGTKEPKKRPSRTPMKPPSLRAYSTCESIQLALLRRPAQVERARGRGPSPNLGVSRPSHHAKHSTGTRRMPTSTFITSSSLVRATRPCNFTWRPTRRRQPAASPNAEKAGDGAQAGSRPSMRWRHRECGTLCEPCWA
jgi:hypothetical protein